MVNSIMIACSILGGHSTCNKDILLLNLNLIPFKELKELKEDKKKKNNNVKEIKEKIISIKNKFYKEPMKYFMTNRKLNIYRY